MSKFTSENKPLPIINGVTNDIKETVMAQFYRAVSSDPGYQLTVNGTTQTTLPNGAFNIQQSLLGFSEFINGNEVKITKAATYVHTLFVNVYSTIPVNGIVAVDIIDKNSISYAANVLATKNINPASAEALILTCIIRHDKNDTCRLRFGGGETPIIPSGLNFKGDWMSQNYIIDDLVIWTVVQGGNDGFYKCILNTTLNQNPGDSMYWINVANAPGSDLELNITSIMWRIIEQ